MVTTTDGWQMTGWRSHLPTLDGQGSDGSSQHDGSGAEGADAHEAKGADDHDGEKSGANPRACSAGVGSACSDGADGGWELF